MTPNAWIQAGVARERACTRLAPGLRADVVVRRMSTPADAVNRMVLTRAPRSTAAEVGLAGM
jgi:hypothetical protein